MPVGSTQLNVLHGGMLSVFYLIIISAPPEWHDGKGYFQETIDYSFYDESYFYK
jgi:hypothetical protein